MDEIKKPEFEVGYRKPPRRGQFKPGQSGNPAGRPKETALTFSEAFMKELNTLVHVVEGNKRRLITKLEAIAKQHTNKAAATGDLKSTALIMRAVEPRESERIDNLSPVLHELRAIHAAHEAVSLDENRAIDDFVLAEDTEAT